MGMEFNERTFHEITQPMELECDLEPTKRKINQQFSQRAFDSHIRYLVSKFGRDLTKKEIQLVRRGKL